MNKKIFFALTALLTAATVGAQEETDSLTVFDVQNKTASAWQTDKNVSATIIGRDDRQEITGRASDYDKAVVVLEMKSGNQKSLCSGTMVGYNLVLTAGHCVVANGKFVDSVSVHAVGLPAQSSNKHRNRNGSKKHKKQQPPAQKDKNHSISDFSNLLRSAGTQSAALPTVEQKVAQAQDKAVVSASSYRAFPSATAKKMIVPDSFITASKKPYNLNTGARHDYAVIVLDSNLGKKTGYLGLTNIKDNKKLQKAQIAVVGRGGDKPARTLWSAKGTVGEVNSYYIYHNADVVGGNSGGPIFYDKDHTKIIALANFGDRRDHAPSGYLNGGLRINKTIMDIVSKKRK